MKNIEKTKVTYVKLPWDGDIVITDIIPSMVLCHDDAIDYIMDETGCNLETARGALQHVSHVHEVELIKKNDRRSRDEVEICLGRGYTLAYQLPVTEKGIRMSKTRFEGICSAIAGYRNALQAVIEQLNEQLTVKEVEL